jgi:hypothetical protein
MLLEPDAPEVEGVPVDGVPVDGLPVDGVPVVDGEPGVAPAVGAPDRSWTFVNTKLDDVPAGAAVVVPPDPLERQPLTVTVCPIMFFRLSCPVEGVDGRVVCGVEGGVCGVCGDGVCAITPPANVTLNASAAAFRNAFLVISSPCLTVPIFSNRVTRASPHADGYQYCNHDATIRLGIRYRRIVEFREAMRDTSPSNRSVTDVVL